MESLRILPAVLLAFFAGFAVAATPASPAGPGASTLPLAALETGRQLPEARVEALLQQVLAAPQVRRAPDPWMQQAAGAPVGPEALPEATTRALEQLH